MHRMTSSRYHNIYENNAVCFWTSAIVGRIPLFSSATAARAVLSILDECRARCGVKLPGYVLMPDHVHLAAWSERAQDVQRFLRQVLGISSAKTAALAERAAGRGNETAAGWLRAFQARSGGGQVARVWKDRGRAFPVTAPDALLQKLTYMHANPVRAGLVAQPEYWEFSSAAWYLHGTGPLRIDTLEW